MVEAYVRDDDVMAMGSIIRGIVERKLRICNALQLARESPCLGRLRVACLDVEILEALQRLLYLCLIPLLSCWRFLIWRDHSAGGTWLLSRQTANLVVLGSEELMSKG